MVPSITTTLQRLTGEWAMLLQPDAILAACGEIGYTGWGGSVLTPVTTVQAFLLRIIHGNSACTQLTPQLNAIRPRALNRPNPRSKCADIAPITTSPPSRSTARISIDRPRGTPSRLRLHRRSA
jgi:hypothetical protein